MVSRIQETNYCPEIRSRIIGEMKSCQAIKASELAERTGTEYGVTRELLDELVEQQAVEVLRPLPPVNAAANAPRAEKAPGINEHFRLIRETDEDYLWEQQVWKSYPASRVADSRYCCDEEGEPEPRESWGWIRRAASASLAIPGF